jgi:hypothetical protein
VQPVPDLRCHHEPVRHGNLPASSAYNSIVVRGRVRRSGSYGGTASRLFHESPYGDSLLLAITECR